MQFYTVIDLCHGNKLMQWVAVTTTQENKSYKNFFLC